VEDRDGCERLEVEEQDEADVPLAGSRRDLHALAAGLVGQVGAQAEGMDAEPRQAAVHRLEQVVACVTPVRIGVRARPVDRDAVRVVDERRVQRIDRVAHPQDAAHVGVVEEERHPAA
jgi:hypothetical protein